MNIQTQCLLTEIGKFTPAAILPSLTSIIRDGEESSINYFENLGNQGLLDYKQLEHDVRFMQKCDKSAAILFLHLLRHSKSQLRQDVHVLLRNNMKENGYFVEIGAHDGISFSNTYMLEQIFNWKGIVVEPSPQFNTLIRKNRSCFVDTRCVYTKSNKIVDFVEHKSSSLSGIQCYNDANRAELSGKESRVIQLNTISLNDLLGHYEAPSIIDYISVDTEGSEFSILENFDFGKYKVQFFSIEHNYSSMRDDLTHLMETNGYKRIMEEYSQWDDWYVPTNSR